MARTHDQRLVHDELSPNGQNRDPDGSHANVVGFDHALNNLAGFCPQRAVVELFRNICIVVVPRIVETEPLLVMHGGHHVHGAYSLFTARVVSTASAGKIPYTAGLDAQYEPTKKCQQTVRATTIPRPPLET